MHVREPTQLKVWTETKFKDLNNPDKDEPLRNPVQSEKEIFWEKPPKDFLKLNFDGSKLADNRASLGYSIRNHDGKVILLGAKLCGFNSILIAETLALREGILASKSLGIKKIIVEV